MKVICNTTPFIALSSIGQILLLKEIYSSIITPIAVIEEVAAGGVIHVPDLASFDWIEIVSNIAPVEKRILFQLDYGEQQVVLNALKIKPDLVLIDDRTARNIAEYLGFNVKGTPARFRGNDFSIPGSKRQSDKRLSRTALHPAPGSSFIRHPARDEHRYIENET
jgi:predicted nucleic acid-binding protein